MLSLRARHHAAALTALALSAIALAGCGGRRPKTALPASYIGTQYAKQAQYMTFLGRTESTPAEIRHEVIRDEATLVTLDTEKACFQVGVRTAIQFDEPVDALTPTCKGRGFKTQAIITDEKVSVVDYPYTGERAIMTAQGVIASELVNLKLTEPAPQTFRVIERQAALCCPTGGSHEVSLVLSNGRMQTPIAPFSAKFTWIIQ